MILILGDPGDPHIRRVQKSLDDNGAPHRILWTGDFPYLDQGTVLLNNERLHLRYRNNLGEINLDDVDVVWYRRIGKDRISPNVTSRDSKRFASAETWGFFRGIWNLLGDRPWINSFHADQAAGSKIHQLATAQRIGLSIPSSIISNDVSEVKTFFSGASRDIIYKPLETVAFEKTEGDLTHARCIYTNIITPEQLERYEQQISLCPCLFQEYVPKEVELRITVVGTSFFTAAIHSQESQRAKIDWRRYDLDGTPHTPYTLPPAYQSKLRLFLDELGLFYGAIDCIVRPDGEIVFLEVNPGGQWLWIEELTRLQIGHGIASALMSFVSSRARIHRPV